MLQRRFTQNDVPLARALGQSTAETFVYYAPERHPVDAEMDVSLDLGEEGNSQCAGRMPWRRVIHRIYHADYVVVAGWSSWICWCALAFRGMAGRPVGLRFDTIAPAPGRWRRLSMSRSRCAMRLSTTLHPVGRAASSYAETLSDRPQVPLPYVVDDILFSPLATKPASQVVRVLVVAKLNDRENVETVIRALSGVPYCLLKVVGEGPNKDRLRSMADEHKVPVQFLGYVPYPNLPEYYRWADLFVHSARSEPWGVSLQEAVWSGTPFLASKSVGALLEFGEAPEVPMSFDPEDSRALSTLIERYADAPARAALLAQQEAASRHLRGPEIARAMDSYLGERK